MSTTSAQRNERKNILEMVAAGKITASDAADLLAALSGMTEKHPDAPEAPEVPTAPEAHTPVGKTDSGRTAQRFHIRVNDLNTGKSKVKISLPIGFLKFGLNLGHKFAPETESIKWEQINEMFNMAEGGPLIDVADQDSGDHVQIYLD